jgi:hypothetical protein
VTEILVVTDANALNGYELHLFSGSGVALICDNPFNSVILSVLTKDLDAASKIEILREYAQDDGCLSSIAGVAQSRDDSG